MNPLSILSAGSTLFGGNSGGSAPAAAGPVTFGNVTQSGGNSGLSTAAVIGIAVAVAVVGAVLVFAFGRGK